MRLAPPLLASIATLISGLVLTAPLTGCPGDDAKCTDYTPGASFDATTPKTLSGDVMPIFKGSCVFTSCHGSASGNSNGVFLGDTDPKKLHAAIVDVRSGKLPTMSFVTPGDPHESFLMRKMDGSHCLLDAQCTDGNCGQSMPRNQETLEENQRNVVRAWIAQGAKND